MEETPTESGIFPYALSFSKSRWPVSRARLQRNFVGNFVGNCAFSALRSTKCATKFTRKDRRGLFRDKLQCLGSNPFSSRISLSPDSPKWISLPFVNRQRIQGHSMNQTARYLQSVTDQKGIEIAALVNYL